MTLMGLVSWIAAGLTAFALARLVDRGRRSWPAELTTSIVVALLAGLAATAMNFGGWHVLEPVAVAFCLLTAAAAVALLRLTF